MNELQIKQLKEQYPPGTCIMLDSMGDDPRPIESGTTGRVKVVDDMGTLHCIFDNGRKLGICPEADRFHKIEQEEQLAPQMSM